MKQRSTDILLQVIKHKTRPLSLEQLAQQYEVSQKTLRNDIKDINDFLSTIPADCLVISDDGRLTAPEHFDELLVRERLYDMDAYLYKLSSTERQNYLMVFLTLGQHHLTMQQFADELFVSRITIVNDMEALKERFSSHGAELELDPGKGMLLQADEETRIRILIDLFRETCVDTRNYGYFARMLLSRLDIAYPLSEIFSHVQEYMKLNKLVFVENVVYDIVLYIFVLFNFFQKFGRAATIPEGNETPGPMLFYAGEKMDVNITRDMLDGYLAYVEENGLHSYIKSIDEIELYKVLARFIKSIDQEIHLGLSDDNVLLDSLLLHIRSIKDWGDDEIAFSAEDYDGPVDYHVLSSLVDKYAPILEDYLGYQLSDNIRKSIVIHICVSAIRNRRNLQRASVLIVCPGSMATGKYLEAQIRDYFDFHIVGVTAAGEVARELSRLAEPVDFIISTVAVQIPDVPCIRVHPLLRMEDLNKIQKSAYQLKNTVGSSMDSRLQQLSSMVKDLFEDPGLADYLCEQIPDLILNYRKHATTSAAEIAALLEENSVQKTSVDLPWRDAIRAAAQPLVDKAYILPDYVSRCIDIVEEYGDYIVVSPGVALAHAGKDYGVRQDCLSLLVSEPGIVFSEEQAPVHLLFCYAAASEDEHIDLLKSIIRLGREPGRVEQIRALSSCPEIYRFLTTAN